MPKRLPLIMSVLLLVAVWVVCRLVAEVQWFREVGYAPVYGVRLATKAGIGAIVTLLSATFLLGNLILAERLHPLKRYRIAPNWAPNTHYTGFSTTQPPASPPSWLPFRWLLPLTLGLSFCLVLLLLHCGQTFWEIIAGSAYGTTLPLPPPFKPATLLHLSQAIASTPVPFLGLGLAGTAAIALLIYPRLLLVVVTCFSVAVGIILSAHWDKWLQGLHPTTFNRFDPVFGRDISFFVFALPLWELLEFWLVGVVGVGLLSVALVYLLAGNSLSRGRLEALSQPQKRHLYGLCGGAMLIVALSDWLSRYELLYSVRGVVYGASYTDIRAGLPMYTLLSGVSLGLGLLFLGRALTGGAKVRPSQQKIWRSPSLLLLSAYLLLTISAYLLPEIVQRLTVQPNELAREQPYIQRAIASTRAAFDLDQINVQTFNPQDSLTAAAIQANDLTIRNIRLWDTRPLLQTNRQLQQIRPYYKFYDADIDRYTILQQTGDRNTKQQVLISARELDYSAVPQIAQTWINEHLVYTHGYGFTLSPVNRVAAGGLPDYYVKDIGTGAGGATAGKLVTSNEQIRRSIPIGFPRIYYGEMTNTYVMTGTRMQELDFPSGNDNVYNRYDGKGGVSIGSLGWRWLYAIYLHDWQMVLTNNFTPESRLLFRRNINQRIRAIAPFLSYDHDPYLVIADATDTPQENYLYWIVDAYTVSDRYPYSDPTQIKTEGRQGKPLNYIRNSVKVVIDAYHGSINFYITNPQDPMIQTWAKVFPGLFKPFSQMPASLQAHTRFPMDLFTVQSERLLTYHMTDPQVFYNREDQWQVPTEIYGNQPRLVDPYYLITKLPTAAREEFVLLLPFTPRQRTNLTAWLAARSDGDNYGKALLYTFPKQELIFGTEQIEARINQDPVISQQISLWNRQGSQAIQGNLLVVPIDQSLLYVEPLYLEATQNSLPTLVRVIVAYGNQIVMSESLEQSLSAIFTPPKPKPAIVRPVE